METQAVNCEDVFLLDGWVPMDLPDPWDEARKELFLLDGRPLLDLPDTWDEARKAFQVICQEEGPAALGAQASSVAEEEGFRRRLCQHDLASTAKELDRSLLAAPSIHTPSGGDGACCALSRRLFLALDIFGFMVAFLALAYELDFAPSDDGYRREFAYTVYSYPGWGASAPEERNLSCGVPVYLREGSHNHSRSRSHRFDDSGRECAVDGANGICVWQPGEGETLRMDDIMTTGFRLNGKVPQLRLNEVSAARGEDSSAERMGRENPSPSTWRPASQQDGGEEGEEVTDFVYWCKAIAVGLMVLCIQLAQDHSRLIQQW